MRNKKTIFLSIIALLLATNVFFGFQYVNLQKEFKQTQAQLAAQRTNEKVLVFIKLFVGEVLQSDEEVNFETRLLLENSVRAIGDEEILAQWRSFTESTTEVQAQGEVKNLLVLLVRKLESGSSVD
ncbi:hypothetical protein IIB97_01790 [Patescibacteria group bacterium]|nr:hypothetical protein [Patescibacteria group bacterium]